MKVTEIVESLLSHEITKEDAINKLTNKVKKNDFIEFNVIDVGFTSESNHGRIRLEIPYGYSNIEGKIKKGDKVYLSII